MFCKCYIECLKNDDGVTQKNIHLHEIPYKTLIIHFYGIIKIDIYFTSQYHKKITFVIQITIKHDGIHSIGYFNTRFFSNYSLCNLNIKNPVI